MILCSFLTLAVTRAIFYTKNSEFLSILKSCSTKSKLSCLSDTFIKYVWRDFQQPLTMLWKILSQSSYLIFTGFSIQVPDHLWKLRGLRFFRTPTRITTPDWRWCPDNSRTISADGNVIHCSIAKLINVSRYHMTSTHNSVRHVDIIIPLFIIFWNRISHFGVMW